MPPDVTFKLQRARQAAFVLGAVCLTLSVLGAVYNSKQFFIIYLSGYLYWLGLSLGCFVVAMLHHLTGGRWGFVTRRFLEAGFMTLPLMALLFIPIVLGVHELYPWAEVEWVRSGKSPESGTGYMSHTGFITRAAVVFALWLVAGWLLRRWSLQQDQRADSKPTRWLRALSGPTLVIHAFLSTVVLTDWVMSTEPHWHSTLFALIILIGHVLTTFAFLILLLAAFRRTEPIASAMSSIHFQHVGSLFLAFAMFWTYLCFSQYLIIYSGNLPHPASWYLHRTEGGWKWLLAALAMFHFFVPFLFLLFRSLKTEIRALAVLAFFVFLAHFAHSFWLIVPSYRGEDLVFHWLSVMAPIGLGAIWIGMFLFNLARQPLLPLRDPGKMFAADHEY